MPQITDPGLLATLEKPQTAIDKANDPQAVKNAESERTAAFLGTRVASGLIMLRELDGKGGPTIGTEAAGAIPFGLGNYATNEARQRTVAAQLDLIDAALTLGTGAAYTPGQLESYRVSYFPQLGDKPGTVADKQRRLKVLLESAKVKSGTAASQIDEALAAAGMMPQTGDRGELVFNDQLPDKASTSRRLTPEQEQELGAFLATKPDIDQINTWWLGKGFGPLENAAQVAQAVQAGQRVEGVDYSRVDEIKLVDMGDGALGAGARGVADTLTLGLYPRLQAGVDTLRDGGTYGENLDRARGVRRFDEEEYGYARLAGQVGGGFALPVGAARGALGLARVGAAYGGAYGFNSEYGSMSERLAGGVGGAAVGGAGAGALGLIGNRLARGGPPVPPAGRLDAVALIEAAQRQGIDPLPSQVGGPLIRRITSGAKQTVFGSGPVVNAERRVNDQAGDIVTGIANSEGVPVRQEVLGERMTGAAQNYINDSAAAGGRLYEGARRLEGGNLYQGGNAAQNLNAQIRELSDTANVNAPLLAGLNRIRADLFNDQGLTSLPIDSIRRLRTGVASEARTEGLRGTDYQRRAGLVLNDLRDDIAGQMSPQAATAFLRADAAWSERLNIIDDVMNTVIGARGDRSAEAVANRLISMSRGDSARLRSFMQSATNEESGILRGSLINELGRATSSAQDEAGERFSLQTFLTNWDKLPDRSRNLLFRGDNRAAIEDIALVASRTRDAGAFTNTSSTAGATNVSQAIRTASTIAAWASWGATAVLENLTGRLLASPRFARWLARTPRDRGTAVRRLASIAASEPAIQPDIQPILNALSEGASRAAAGENVDSGRQEPPRQQSPQQ